VIDLSTMKGVRVDPETATVRVEAGCTSGDVDHATHAFGLAVPFGIVSTTGVAGLTLGGGTGLPDAQYGLTIDNLLEADVVLADGSFVTASKKEHPDLFWALRGGGGNFGVVTSFLFQAHPVKMVFAGPIFWDAKHAKEIMRAYRDFLPTHRRTRRLRRPEDGAVNGPVPARGVGQAGLRDHLQLQRDRRGWQRRRWRRFSTSSRSRSSTGWASCPSRRCRACSTRSFRRACSGTGRATS
jgi:FAD/FMN-containing dehydrogenase